MVNNMTYQNGKIYCIRNTIDDDIYVGSTTQLLSERMCLHRSKVKANLHHKLYLKMYKFGLDKFYIELIENCPCSSKEELRKSECFFCSTNGNLKYLYNRTHAKRSHTKRSVYYKSKHRSKNISRRYNL